MKLAIHIVLKQKIRTISGNESILKVRPKRHNTNYYSTLDFKFCQVLMRYFGE
jgi:hypothetical protein